MTLEEAIRQRGIQLPSEAAPMRTQGGASRRAPRLPGLNDLDAAPRTTGAPRLPDLAKQEAAAARQAERQVASAARAAQRLETANLAKAYQDRGIDTARDVTGRPVPLDSERNKAAGVTPGRLRPDGTADTSSFDESKVMAIKPRPADSPEVIALRQTKGKLAEVAKYHETLVKDFDAGPGALLGWDDASQADALGGEIDRLEAESADKVGSLRGALTPGVAAGNASPKAIEAQNQLSDLVKRAQAIDANVRSPEDVRQLRAALIDQRKRVAEQAGKAQAAQKAAELAYGAELAKAFGPLATETPQPPAAVAQQVAEAQARPAAKRDEIPEVSFWNEFGKNAADLGRSFAAGGGGLVKMVGDIYGLATGDMDNAASQYGGFVQEFWNEGKTDDLKAREVGRKQRVDAAQGEFAKAIEWVKATASDPSLLANAVAEQVPNLVPAAGAGAVTAKVASKALLRKAAGDAVKIAAAQRLAATVGAAAGIGAGGVQQGADVGAGSYADELAALEKMTDAQALAIPDIAAAVRAGEDIDVAKTAYALAQGRKVGVVSGALSIAVNAIPGGGLIEKAAARAAVGGAAKSATGTLARQAGVAALKTAGEAGTEVIEEGGGQVATNVAAQQGTDPNRPTMQGVGEASGQAALMGGVIGGPVAVSEIRRGGQNGGQNDGAANENTPLPSVTAASEVDTNTTAEDDGTPFSPALDDELAAELAQSPAGMEEGQAASTEPAPATPAPGFSSSADVAPAPVPAAVGDDAPRAEQPAPSTAEPLSQEPPVGDVAAPQITSEEQKPTPAGSTPAPADNTREAAEATEDETQGVVGASSESGGSPAPVSSVVAQSAEQPSPKGQVAGSTPADVASSPVAADTDAKLANRAKMLRVQLGRKNATPEARARTEAKLAEIDAEQQRRTPTQTAPQAAAEELRQASQRRPTTLPAANPQGGSPVSSPEGNSQQAPLADLPPAELEKRARRSNALERFARDAKAPAELAKVMDELDATPLPNESRVAVALLNNPATDDATFERAATKARAAEPATPESYIANLRQRRTAPSQPPASESDQPQAPTNAPTPEPAQGAGQVFEQAKAQRDAIEAEVRAADAALKAIPGVGSGASGLTPDAVKSAPAYAKAKGDFDRAFAKQRKFNQSFTKQFKAELAAERAARRPQTSTPSPRPADVSKTEAKTDTSVSNLQKAPVSEIAPPAKSKPLIPRGRNTPAEFIKSIAAETGLSGTGTPMRAMLDLAARLNRAAPEAFRGMEVFALSEAEWAANPATGSMTPESAAAYNPETNTLYLRTERVKRDRKTLISSIVHEAGHFAQKFLLSDPIVRRAWAKLADAQVEQAAADYNPNDTRTADVLRKDERVYQEWVAQQFARVVAKKTQGINGDLRARLQAFLDVMKEFATKWLGSDFASSPAFDAEVLRVMGFNEDAQPVTPPVTDVTPDVTATPSAPPASLPATAGVTSPQAARPARKPSKFKVSDDLRKGIDDLLGTPAEPDAPTFTRKFGAKIIAANNVIGMIVRDNPQITSRAALGEFIAEVEPRLKPFSEALFSILSGAVDTVNEGPSDWNAIYGNEAPANTEPAEPTVVADKSIVQVPTANLRLSTDVPQFKKNANADTGVVEPLAGEYDPTGNVLQVWRRRDGRLEVISGRHRFDLARRTGVSFVSVQIHDEAAGFDARAAARLDAELNIRDGQGSVADYANYFRNSDVTEKDAEFRGLLARGKGKAGFRLAREASADLFALHQAGRINDAQAEAIILTARDNVGAQQVGIRAALDGGSAERIADMVTLAKQAADRKKSEGETGDLFGFDDSAMKEMEAQAVLAAKERKELAEQISAVQGAAKRPEIAKKFGVDAKNPKSILAKVNELRTRIDALKANPALAGKPADTTPAPAKPKAEPAAPTLELREPTEAEKKSADEAKRRREQAEAIEEKAAAPIIGDAGDQTRDMFGGGDMALFDSAQPNATVTPAAPASNEPSPNPNLERDRGDAATQDGGRAPRVRPERAGDGANDGGVGELVSGRAEQGGAGDSAGVSPADREGGDSILPERRPGAVGPGASIDGGEQSAGGGAARGPRIVDVAGADAAVDYVAAKRPSVDRVAGERESTLADRIARQRLAETVPVIDLDPANIAETLPVLLPEQHDDVLKAERRFYEAKAKGILFTNGTGTGKTYTGLGIIKRFVRKGARDVLIVVPSSKKAMDWREDGERLGLDIGILEGITDAGSGLNVTTYANFRTNEPLAARDFDLVVYDESHKLMENAEGERTSGTQRHQFVTNHESAVVEKVAERVIGQKRPRGWEYPKEKFEDFQRDLAAWDARAREKKDEIASGVARIKDKTRVVFLSATPFAYHKTLGYADGYLFRSPERSDKSGYNVPQGFDRFLVENFGYRMRTGKLTAPEAEVNMDLMERAFADRLMKEGAMSGRSIDVPYDYSREFVLLDAGLGAEIDRGIGILRGWIDRDQNGFKSLPDQARERFNYIYTMQLLEAVKVAQSIDRIRQHIAAGRKVILFHDYNNANPQHPFKGFRAGAKSDAELKEIDAFEARYPELVELDMGTLRNPLALLAESFGEQAVFFNGTVSAGKRQKNVKAFNDDASPVKLLVAQSDAMAEGVSAHDTTGKHQRVVMNVGLPVKPTKAIQEEGRAYRVGVKSNAVYEYVVIHTGSEKYAFGSKINLRVRTAENLALGSQARALQDSFKQGYLNPITAAPSDTQGRGGKDADRRAAVMSEFDRAKTLYFARQKKTQRTKSAEGVDYFATPEPIGLKMVDWAQARPNEKMLEPSAGHGAIASFFPISTKNTYVEPSLELAEELRIKVSSGETIIGTFEDLNVVNKFDAIVLNPPFGQGGSTAMKHLAKAATHLRDGGRIIALIPEGPSADAKFDKWYEGSSTNFIKVAEYGLPNVVFERAGANVKTRIVVIDRIDDQDRRSEAPTRQRVDISGETIGEVFERIEQLSAPARKNPEADAAAPLSSRDAVLPVVSAPTATQGKPSAKFETAEFPHTKTKKPIYVAKTGKLSDEEYRKASATARRYGGYYSSFKGMGAIPGLHFPTEQARADFLADMGASATLGTPAEREPSDLYRQTPDTARNRGYEVARQKYEREGQAPIMADAKAYVETFGVEAAARRIFALDPETSGSLRSALGNNVLAALQKRVGAAANSDERIAALAAMERFMAKYAPRNTEVARALAMMDRLESFTEQGAINTAVEGAKKRQDTMLGTDGIETEGEIVDAVNGATRDALPGVINDAKADIRKIKVTKKMVEGFLEKLERENPDSVVLVALINAMQANPADRPAAIRAFIDETRQSLWQKYEGAIANAAEKVAEGPGKPKGKPLIGILAADIQKIITDALPKTTPEGVPFSAQDMANRITDIVEQPERFGGAIAAARAQIEASAMDEGKKQTALDALDGLTQLDTGGKLVGPMLTKIIKSVFSDMDLTPKKAAKLGNVKAREIADEITKRVSEMFTGEVANEMASEVDAIVGNMLGEARAAIREQLTSAELKKQFLTAEESKQADKLLATGTADEIAAFLGTKKGPQENERIAALTKELSEKKAKLAALLRKKLGQLSKAELDMAIKGAFADVGAKVSDILRLHYTEVDAIGTSLADKLIAEAGLNEEQAKELARAVRKRIAEKTEDAKLAVLKRLEAQKGGISRRMFTLVDKIVEMSNAGALDRAELRGRIAEELKLPRVTDDLVAKLKELTDKRTKMQPGDLRDRVEIQIQDELRKVQGIGTVDVFTAIYYAHILSGYTTQILNIISTGFNVGADVGNAALRAEVEAMLGVVNRATGGRTDPFLKDNFGIESNNLPVGEASRQAVIGMLTGARMGLTLARATLSTGYSRKAFDQKLPEVSTTLEILSKEDPASLGGKALAKYAWLARYVGRSMKAADAVFARSASEARQRLIAAKLATAGRTMSRQELNQRIRDDLRMNPADWQKAVTQAEGEGMTGADLGLRTQEIIFNQRNAKVLAEGDRLGMESTFNSPPRGAIGELAKLMGKFGTIFPPFKLFVPFTSIVANVTNASLNYSPVGALRAGTGEYMGEAAARFARKLPGGEPLAKFAETLGALNKGGYWGEADMDAEARKNAGIPSTADQIREERQAMAVKAFAGTSAMMILLALGLAGDDEDDGMPFITGKGPTDFARAAQLRQSGWQPYTIRFPGGNRVSYLSFATAIPFAFVGNLVDGMKYNGLSEADAATMILRGSIGAASTITDMSFVSGVTNLMDVLRDNKGAKAERWAAGVATSAVMPNLVRQFDRLIDPTVRDSASFAESVQSAIPIARQQLPARITPLAEPVQSTPLARFGGTKPEGREVMDVLNAKGIVIREPGATTKIGNRVATEAELRRIVEISGPRIIQRLRNALPIIRSAKADKADALVDRIVREERQKAKDSLPVR